MSDYQDTFNPVNVAKPRNIRLNEDDRMDNLAESIGKTPSVTPTPTPTPPTPVQEPQPVPFELQEGDRVFRRGQEPMKEEESQTFEVQEGDQVFRRGSSGSLEQVQDVAVPETTPTLSDEEHAEFRRALLPDSIEAYTYSPNDLAERDDLYGVIEKYMIDRFGSQSVEGESRSDVVEKFLNNRRGVAIAGNSVRVGTEVAWLAGIKDNPEKMKNAGAAYLLYEEMAGITSDEYSWGETGWATFDVVRGIVADPVTIMSLGVGKVVAGAGTKATTQASQQVLYAMIREQLKRGVPKETVRANMKKLNTLAVQRASKEGVQDIARFAARNQVPALRKLGQQAALKEISASTAFDAAAGAGIEWLYQQTLVDTGVQQETNRHAVGLAALGALVVGGASAGLVATRGASGTALPTELLGEPDGAKAAEAVVQEITELMAKQDLPTEIPWMDKVMKGGELDVQDSSFFVDLLLGASRKNTAGKDEIIFKGLGQVMKENGFFWEMRPGVEGDTLSNFIADFIREQLSQEDITRLVASFEKRSGTKMTGFRDVDGNVITRTPTPEEFANAFSRKMHDNARGLNAASQVAKDLTIDVEDLTLPDFLKHQLGLYGRSKGKKKEKTGAYHSTLRGIGQWQNRYIRTLVSHMGTSRLNILGWGLSAGMQTASDSIRALGFASRGTWNMARGAAEQGKTDLNFAKALTMSNIGRVKLLLDPDMTAAAFHSAVQRSSGALEALGKVQAGGIDMEESVEQMLGKTMVGRGADAYVDAAQTLTFVKAQDTFTKSQQFVFEMDQRLRKMYNMSWNQFYASDDAMKIMASKQYQMLEEEAVERTLEHTFSTSFKDSSTIGKVAGVIEDVRKVPGVGLMIPFGKFFNNTVHFTAKNTPVINHILKANGKFQNKTHDELAVNAFVAAGLVYSFARIADEKRRQGLGMYEEIDDTGEVITKKYEYPYSLFMAVGQVASHIMNGEAPPDELLKRVSMDFGVQGLTRSLDTSTKGVLDAVGIMLGGEYKDGGIQFVKEIGMVGSQFAAGFTRPFQIVDQTTGLVMGTEMRPLNVKEGNEVTAKALMYMQNMTQLLTGEPTINIKETAVGTAQATPAAAVGVRPVFLTNTMRVMNVLEYDQWKENAAPRVTKLAAEAANIFNFNMFNDNLEHYAEQAMKDPVFLNATLEDQRKMWKTAVENARKATKLRMEANSFAAGDTFFQQNELVTKYTEDQLSEAMNDLELGNNIGSLDYEQITSLQNYLKGIKLVEEESETLNRPWATR